MSDEQNVEMGVVTANDSAHPYTFSPNRELSNKELTELFKHIGLNISSQVFDAMSITLKSQFKRS